MHYLVLCPFHRCLGCCYWTNGQAHQAAWNAPLCVGDLLGLHPMLHPHQNSLSRACPCQTKVLPCSEAHRDQRIGGHSSGSSSLLFPSSCHCSILCLVFLCVRNHGFGVSSLLAHTLWNAGRPFPFSDGLLDADYW